MSITTAAVLDQIIAISQTPRPQWDWASGTHGVDLDELSAAFGLHAGRGDDLAVFDPILAALRELVDAGQVVEGAVAGARKVYAPAGATLPKEW